MNASFTLPPLVLLADSGGLWEAYVEVIYAHFKNDFVRSTPTFRGIRVGLKKWPMEKGKEATFWHMTHEGPDERNRTPELRRCERIRWPRPIIENDDCPRVKVWGNKRGTEKRILLWFEEEDYLVVLADRDTYVLPWTAYLVELPHRRRKLLREFEEFQKMNP